MASVINGCDSISTFASLLGIPIGITSSALGLKTFVKTCAKAVDIKKSKSIIKKEGKTR